MKEAKQERYDRAYLRMAEQWAELSHCARKKVGAIIVKDQMIISDGYNGTNNCKGATLYLTLSPCKDCSKLILQAGIRRVVYAKGYKDCSGIDFLKEAGIELKHLETLVDGE